MPSIKEEEQNSPRHRQTRPINFDVFLALQVSIFISVINLLAPELFFFILAHPVYKM